MCTEQIVKSLRRDITTELLDLSGKSCQFLLREFWTLWSFWKRPSTSGDKGDPAYPVYLDFQDFWQHF